MTTTEVVGTEVVGTEVVTSWKNGNADIVLYADGTRVINYDGDLQLSSPLNIDIRVSNRCSFGFNPKTGRAICSFCHESATTNGASADFDALFNKLRDSKLPAGTELAIGANSIDGDLDDFLERSLMAGWVCNLTVNQGHCARDKGILEYLISQSLVKGLGISYRPDRKMPAQSLLEYPNTVFHVIAGIDTLDEVKALAAKGVRKILVLGEKDFGFNKGKVILGSTIHTQWYRGLRDLFDLFEVVSFDNLALEQLNVRRFVLDFDTFYQGEYSFYINAVDQTFSPSSRSAESVSWDGLSISQYFQTLQGAKQ